LGTADPGHEHKIQASLGELELEAPVRLSHEPLGACAPHRVSHAATGYEAGFARELRSTQNEENLEPAGEGNTFAVNALEFAGSVKSLAPIEAFVAIPSTCPVKGHYTTSRALPLARRRFKTRRPPFVFMRARKPCFFLRLRLCGWKVRFTMLPHESVVGFGEPRGGSSAARSA
jgi:hypothetical protein